jgi:hypothetical protein
MQYYGNQAECGASPGIALREQAGPHGEELVGAEAVARGATSGSPERP